MISPTGIRQAFGRALGRTDEDNRNDYWELDDWRDGDIAATSATLLDQWEREDRLADAAESYRPTSYYSAPTAPRIPASVSYRCLQCGHWFRDETTFTAHVQFACAGRFPVETLALGVRCECCETLDETLRVKEVRPSDDTR